MTKEFKQITISYGDITTQDFKRAFEAIEKKKITSFTFYWAGDKRISDAEFIARIKKVISRMTKWDENELTYQEGEHMLIVTREITSVTAGTTSDPASDTQTSVSQGTSNVFIFVPKS